MLSLPASGTVGVPPLGVVPEVPLSTVTPPVGGTGLVRSLFSEDVPPVEGACTVGGATDPGFVDGLAGLAGCQVVPPSFEVDGPVGVFVSAPPPDVSPQKPC